MEREIRYTIWKHADIIAANLSDEDHEAMRRVADKINTARQARGKPPLIAVVVESDWPEYEPTWKAIADRVDGIPSKPSEKPHE